MDPSHSPPDHTDSLSILSELATTQPQQQQPHTLSDEAFHALLLASLSYDNKLPPPPPPSTTNSTSIRINNQQQQHAQDLLSALSALQSGTCDPSPSNIDQDPFHPHPPQHELDFDDPNLFSPFEPEHDQIPSNQATRNLLGSTEIDFLLGTPPFESHSPIPSSSTTNHKIYSNSFSSFNQHHNQHDHLNHPVTSNHLAIYDPSSYPSDHQDLNFLFENHPQLTSEECQTTQNNQDGLHQTQDLLDRLDFGIKMNQDHVKLKNLDSLIESSLNFNQIYLDLIKKTLDNLTSRHQEAQKFLTTSKQCIKEIQRQEKQIQRQELVDSNNPTTNGTKKTINKPSTSINNNIPNNNNCTNSNDKDFALVLNHIRYVSLPWFKHKFGVDLPTFEDGKKRDQYNSLLHHQPWQPPERRKLDEEVGYELSINQRNKNLINWDTVARCFPDRKAIECKIQWTQKQDPSINKSKWTPVELDRLFEIVKKFNFQNWDLISNELGTGRTPSDCVKQFRSVTQEKREWTESDDQLLKEGVSTYGQNWQAVAKHCGRSSNQCINRWSKTLRPDIKKGKWDPIEDEALKNAVAAVGMVWKDVAPRVRGRTDAQCRERWCNILDPRIVVGNWSKEEDDRILRMRDVEGKTWSEISKSFQGRRTDNHCMRRHSELKRAKDTKTSRRSHGGSKIRIITHEHQTTLGRVLIPSVVASSSINTPFLNPSSSSSSSSPASPAPDLLVVDNNNNNTRLSARLRSTHKRFKYSS